MNSDDGQRLIAHLKSVAGYDTDNLSFGVGQEVALQVFTLHRFINYIERLPERYAQYGEKAITDNLPFNQEITNE